MNWFQCIYIYTYIHTYKHTYIHTYIQLHTYACLDYWAYHLVPWYPNTHLHTRVKWPLQSVSFSHLDADESWTMMKIRRSATYRFLYNSSVKSWHPPSQWTIKTYKKLLLTSRLLTSPFFRCLIFTHVLTQSLFSTRTGLLPVAGQHRMLSKCPASKTCCQWKRTCSCSKKQIKPEFSGQINYMDDWAFKGHPIEFIWPDRAFWWCHTPLPCDNYISLFYT